MRHRDGDRGREGHSGGDKKGGFWRHGQAEKNIYIALELCHIERY